ncbi:hypothetical protein HIM_04943 [Hirsutella minnesotensis 3608]|uniref:Uncharacterized protein n=1 Tax=Hirsutella minnesotensis 3608 TaxID=1043627 RepID=A0A0F7ZKY8_9HYPO|nr:hypothetical protein HIM_04943 [Hirsutella minnesotensis 3608]
MLKTATISRLGRYILPLSKPCSRFASTATRWTGRADGDGRNFIFMKRWRPMDVEFFTKNGQLITSPENARFLHTYDIEPDNGRMLRFPTTDKYALQVCKDYSCNVAFSPKHVLPGHHLQYFDPRGHPEAAAYRIKYARMKRQEPLWMIIMSTNVCKSCVRHTASSRLRKAISLELKKRGYNLAPGLAPDKEIRGTLWITIRDPQLVARLPPERFAEALVTAMERQYGRPRRQQEADALIPNTIGASS